MAPGVVGLDDPSVGDVAVAGAKGAALARARAVGFPVLDGFVVSPAVSVAVLAAGKEVLGSGGSGAARMAVIRWSLDDSLLADIATAAAGLPEPLIVRSSSVLEGSGEWAGAFTSMPEVRHDEIAKAARSVWATCFSLDVLDRFEAMGLEPGSAPMGVLVQPEIVPDFGGAATVDAHGAVTVTAVKGSPRDLMAGWAPGARAVYEQGALVGDEAVDLLGRALLREVVDLARWVQAKLGHDRIEWAALDGQVVLFQVQGSSVSGSSVSGSSADGMSVSGSVAPGSVGGVSEQGASVGGSSNLVSSVRGSSVGGSGAVEMGGPVVIPAALAHPDALRLTRLTHRYPGALGEELVLAWLPGTPGPVEPRPIDLLHADVDVDADADDRAGVARERLLCAARELAAELTAQAWDERPEQALARARLVLRRLRSDRPNESIDALRELRPVDAGAAATLLGMYEQLVAGVSARQRRGRDRWEPLLAGVAALQGETFTGQPSVGGIGAGRLVWVESPSQTDHVRPRDILVTQYPLANFSPLLWDAAGVITLGGAPSAHLFEVARSLTVPAVVDCPVGDVLPRSVFAEHNILSSAKTEAVLGMVDGDAGRVAVLR